MSTDERIRSRRSFRNPMLLFGIGMTVFYIALGVWLILDKTFVMGIPEVYRNIFATLMLIYGVFRGWRVYTDYF